MPVPPFRQALQHVQTHPELGHRLCHGRAADRLLARLVPIVDRLLDQTGVRAVVGEELGLGVDGVRELLLERLSDAGVELVAAGFEEGTVGRVLD
jgi:hypothetical protein